MVSEDSQGTLSFFLIWEFELGQGKTVELENGEFTPKFPPVTCLLVLKK